MIGRSVVPTDGHSVVPTDGLTAVPWLELSRFSPVRLLDALDAGFADSLDVGEQLLLTALVVVLGIAVVVVGRSLRQRSENPYFPTVISLGVAGFLLVLGLLFVVIWDVHGALWGAVEEQGLEEWVPHIVVSIPIIVGAHVCSVFARQAIQNLLADREAVTAHQLEITYRVTQLLVWTTAFVIVLGVWNVNLAGLLIGAGFLGIVLGMAARQTLGNVVAGLVLMFARPFEIGHWIEIEEDEGVVTDITILNTMLRTPDGEYVIVPNDLVQSAHVTNMSKHGRLRVSVEVGVDYDTDLEHAVETAREAIADLETVEEHPSPDVVRRRFGDSAIVLEARAWIDPPTASRATATTAAMVDAIKDAYDREEISIPFPQRTLGSRSGGADGTAVVGHVQSARTDASPDTAGDGSADSSGGGAGSSGSGAGSSGSGAGSSSGGTAPSDDGGESR